MKRGTEVFDIRSRKRPGSVAKMPFVPPKFKYSGSGNRRKKLGYNLIKLDICCCPANCEAERRISKPATYARQG
ncbi:hypothetical protein V1505DRAFT_370768 [Lipomyces doorenjongii]